MITTEIEHQIMLKAEKNIGETRKEGDGMEITYIFIAGILIVGMLHSLILLSLNKSINDLIKNDIILLDLIKLDKKNNQK